jgi:exodeoxyribonuclease-3
MKLVTWNCQGAFRKKAAAIATLAPDLAVIPEAECIERLHFAPEIPHPTAMAWFGERATKGLSILSYTDWQFSLDDAYDPTIRYCVPLRVSGGAELNVLAVWAMGHRNPRLSYVGQLALAIQRYGSFLAERETIILGDFNSNKQWDHKPRIGNHSWVVAALAGLGLVSVYHAWSGEAQGEESIKTFYMYRQQKQVYHLDYCFVPKRWLARLASFEIGAYEQWRTLSDHMPLFVEFR